MDKPQAADDVAKPDGATFDDKAPDRVCLFEAEGDDKSADQEEQCDTKAINIDRLDEIGLQDVAG